MPYIPANEYRELVETVDSLSTADPLKFAICAYWNSERGSEQERRLELLIDRMVGRSPRRDA